MIKETYIKGNTFLIMYSIVYKYKAIYTSINEALLYIYSAFDYFHSTFIEYQKQSLKNLESTFLTRSRDRNITKSLNDNKY